MFMTSKDLIYKDNKIVEASYKLSLTEQRIILFAISHVNALEKLTEDDVFTITASEYSLAFSIDKKEAFREMKKAMEDLSNRWVKVIDTADRKTSVAWISEKSMAVSNQSIEIRFGTGIAKYLHKLQGNFTKYQIANIRGMKSVYAVRVYEMLIQWKTTKELTITVDKLRDRLEAQSKAYNTFSNVKLKIIDPAIREICEYSDILADYELIKKGVKVSAIRFFYKYKEGREPKPTDKKQLFNDLKKGLR